MSTGYAKEKRNNNGCCKLFLASIHVVNNSTDKNLHSCTSERDCATIKRQQIVSFKLYVCWSQKTPRLVTRARLEFQGFECGLLESRLTTCIGQEGVVQALLAPNDVTRPSLDVTLSRRSFYCDYMTKTRPKGRGGITHHFIPFFGKETALFQIRQ